MDYNIKAKPFHYNGRLYRSRLEARWAAFFTKIGWDFEYEPSEINGFNPDFIIRCISDSYNCKLIIVEVKPLVFVDDKYELSVYEKYKSCSAHILILTDSPFYLHNGYLFAIGRGCQYLGKDAEWGSHTSMHDLVMKCTNDFGSDWILYDGMIYGKVDRKYFIQKEDAFEVEIVKDIWAFAGNEVMFLKPNINTNE